MGACASKFTVLKNTSTAPPPAVKYEVEPKEVNLVEEVAVEKDDAPAAEDEASRRQSLGHLLQEVKSVYLSAFTVKIYEVVSSKYSYIISVSTASIFSNKYYLVVFQLIISGIRFDKEKYILISDRYVRFNYVEGALVRLL